MAFGFGKKKDQPEAQAAAPQMSAEAMSMLQQMAQTNGATPAAAPMAPSMAPAMAPAMAPGMPAGNMGQALPASQPGGLPAGLPDAQSDNAGSGKPRKLTREEKKAAALAKREAKEREKRRKKGTKSRFSRAKYLREANGNAAAGLALSIMLLLITVIGPIMLNFGYLLPQTRDNEQIVLQVNQFNDVIARAQPLLQAAIQNKNQREQAIQGRLAGFQNVDAVTGQLRSFVSDLEAAGAVLAEDSSGTVVNTNVGVTGLIGKTITLKVRADFLRYLMVRNKFVRSQSSINVSGEKIAATPGDPIVDIEVTLIIPAISG